ncbi:MAG TPA: glycosyltransferase family 1 protein [Stellaceae bacterium]|nr:glycosyltransferase family 1 protein [Stellaceae bacterium]
MARTTRDKSDAGLIAGLALLAGLAAPDGATAPSPEGRAPASEPRADGTPPDSASPGPARPDSLRFHIDEVSERQIAGWVIRPAEPGHRCLVAVKEAGRVIARTVASRFRSDLAAVGIGDGCHSFGVATPRLLLDGGEHLLEIVEHDSGTSLTGGPIRWRVEPLAFHPAAAELPGADAARAEIGARVEGGERRRLSAAPGRAAAGRRERYAASSIGPRILFDISDLVYYIGHHANLTGIQRVQSSIVLAILRNELVERSNLLFLSFNARTRNWVQIPTGFLAVLLEDLFLPASERPASFSREDARDGILPGAHEFSGDGVLDDGSRSILCLVGAAWVHPDYFHRVLDLKRRFGTRFVMTVHDLIPIYARDTCDQDTARVFEEFIGRGLRHADHLLSVSENTAADIRRYAQALKLPEPAITVTRNGSSFAEFLPEAAASGAGEARPVGADGVPQRFVLFVATIEGRKNHQLMFDIWQRMVEDGMDPPHLVCVGRVGWKSSAFIGALVATNYLDGRIHLLRDVSDTDLAALYRRCLFTVCPTLYEGWGLPVGESLAMGKICVSSDRASLPEVAGDCGVYIDIADFAQSLAVVRDLIADGAKRKRLEAKIRRCYQRVSWRSVAERVVEACLTAAQREWQAPYPHTAIPYASEVGFARLDRELSDIGELLLTRIAGARRGVFLGEALGDQAFARGEEIRSGGTWAHPEEWGTWACHAGGEVTLALAPCDSIFYYVVLRLRGSDAFLDQPIRISANGEPAWAGSLGAQSRDLAFRVRRRAPDAGGWLLRVRAELDLTPELRGRIALLDSRIPTIGFERLVVVPEDDLKTRLDILYRLLL